MNRSQWQGRVAVVTGAGSGIGAGLVRCCLARGMHVYACDVDGPSLAALDSKLGSGAAGSLTVSRLDVRELAQVDRLAETVFDAHGEVNLLFNNAGVLVDGKSWERLSRDWRWIIDVNVMGVVHGIQAFVPRMLEQGTAGRVVNTSSVGGLLGGGPYMAPYQGTKHMVTAITESLYQELQGEQAPVSASVLCPGEVATGIWSSDRLRGEHEQNVLGSRQEQRFHDAVAGSVAAGLDPDDFAARVFEGIEAGRFWLLPQADFKDRLQMRHDSILNETNPLNLFELMGLAVD